MSKRQFKSQASSGRVGAGFGGFGSTPFGAAPSSTLSYVQEPPDYSAISDANVAVAFKNLSKKDSTTKAKALDDLQGTLIPADVEVENAVVETWVKLFPRLSIDNARRVRQLAHSLNGKLCAKCGKRIAKHLTRIAGPWLAGTFDNDRTVAKAAQDAFTGVFSSKEKILGFRKTFQESILEYCKVALLNETVQTLSDERSVNSEDAEATYARVVSSSLCVVTSLLDSLPADELQKQFHTYQSLAADSKLWEMSSHADSSVRRSLHRLVQTFITKQPQLVQDNLKNVSKAYIYKGLASDQMGSAIDFSVTLDSLTTSFPGIWTDSYSGKKSAVSRLQQFLKRGSQGSTTVFWDTVQNFIRRIPVEVLPRSYDEIADLLLSARDGVTRKEERFNASSAWPTYFSLTDVVTAGLSDEDAENLLEAFAMPPLNQFVYPDEETTRWSIDGSKAAKIVSKAALVRRLAPLLEKNWPRMTDKLIELAKTSQPEQSKDFDKSQKHVLSTGERFSELQRELYSEEYRLPSSLSATFGASSIKLLKECTSLLRARSGKPYGAAAMIEEQLRACGPQLLQNKEYNAILTDFATGSIPGLMYSPSRRHLSRCVFAIQDESTLQGVLHDALQNVLEAQEPHEAKATAIGSLFPPTTPSLGLDYARNSALLQNYLSGGFSTSRDPAMAGIFADLLKLGAVSTETTNTVLSGLVNSLSLSNPQARESLSAIDQLAVTNHNGIQTFMSGESGKQLLPMVLKLEQSSDETVAEKATTLSTRLSSTMGGAATTAKFGIVLQSLESVSEQSLPIEAVIELIDKIELEERDELQDKGILPRADLWYKSILAVMRPLRPSLSLLSPLGGTVHLIRADDSATPENSQYDADGLSQALRIAIYTAHILKKPGRLDKLKSHANDILALLNICLLLAEDNTSIRNANGLWLASKSETTELEVMDFASVANDLLRQQWRHASSKAWNGDESSIVSSLHELLSHCDKNSPMAYYADLAAANALDNLFETHGSSNDLSKEFDNALKSRRAAKNILALTSFIVGHAQPLSGSQTLTRLCNELIADLTDLSMDTDESNGLEQLVTLNIILRSHDEILESVQKTRLIFFVKRAMSWLENDTLPSTKAETCRTMALLTPHIGDMYGEHWTQMVDILKRFWNSGAATSDGTNILEDGILLVHASLRLFGTLQRLSKADEPNDDLLEALQENKDQMHQGLIELLKSSGEASDETHQPLMVTNELLARELSRVQLKPLQDVEELFPLLYAPSHAIQGAAFDLLHKQVPAAQEQISFDAAIENKTAQLPDELLSLVINAPTLEALAAESFQRTMPLLLQGFLYSWRVIFDHFDGSSYRVKSNYIEQLKDGAYLSGLLDLIFDFLGHTRGRPVDASKLDIQEYIAGTEPNPERDVQWLLSHLYYLALSHLPSLVKSYFLDIRSRQTLQAIETWTAKYISPLVIAANLQAVAEWADKSVKDDPDYENMTVKVGMRSKEINVSYLVDEQTMGIKVVLPEAYPLESAKVVSVNRVAVREEKWQSWLRNCQGVITFSNGSITDGLSAWRKNVIGALKGQTECAICYSIISGDKQLPTKRCPTCKNLFHSSCLLKWFKTSNASTCPLCRNPFNFN